MSIGAVFVGFLLAGLTVYAAALPLRRAGHASGPADPATSPAEDRLAGLEAQRDALFAALADLEVDRSLGKLNDEDYQMVRNEMMAQTVTVLRGLDAPTADIESQVEALVRARRAEMTRSAPAGKRQDCALCPTCSEPVRLNDHFCTRCGAELNHSCPRCGAGVKSGDVFCASCGSTLLVGAAA